MEGLADLLFSVSKLAGGWAGHRSEKKRVLGTLGYLATALCTGAMALTQIFSALLSLRAAAWVGRGFRSPLRDFMLADEVGPTHFGRAYGVERAADMLGAVVGPLIAVLLLGLGLDLDTIILASVAPSAVAVVSFFSMTRDRPAPVTGSIPATRPGGRLPRRFWWFTAGVTLFGLGDFSRTFLIFLAAAAVGESDFGVTGSVSTAVLLYALHNAVSAIAAYPAGHFGDRRSKLGTLVLGYGLGVVTNGMLAFAGSSIDLLTVAIVLSGVYIAVEETLEKAVAVEMLPREQRSLGLGWLAAANAAGDMLSSIGVGVLLATGYPRAAFLVPAAFGLLGTVWMIVFRLRLRSATPGIE
jgi:MFS family permease